MKKPFQFQFLDSIKDLPEHSWNRLAHSHGPFLRYEFFAALENNNCTNADTGWSPHHLAVYAGENGPVVAVVPLFIKTHSYGEYVFDWSWADAYYRNGLEYYPKLVTAIPFTPSSESRILIDEAVDQEEILSAIVKAIISEAKRLGASSWHVLFPKKEESASLNTNNIHQRQGTQFHWFNKGYLDFDHFLDSFSSRKRKNIRKERSRVIEGGFSFQRIEGAQITTSMWKQFYEFYQNTYRVRGQEGYLTQSFFEALSTSMPESIVLIVALKEGEVVAGALSFKDSNRLYGRYWGCREEYQFLHFETCYYQGIDYAIEHSLTGFDSGAQGEHKIQRGFEPIATYSNHWIHDERFETAIVDFLKQESAHVEQYRQSARSLLPFKENL